jgi:hypothetical protein
MPSNVEVTVPMLLETRRVLAQRITEIDREIARLTAPPPRKRGQPRPNVASGPYVLVRDDNAVYAGRWRGYRHDEAPYPFRYRGAAEGRAKRDKLETSLVVALPVWLAARGEER